MSYLRRVIAWIVCPGCRQKAPRKDMGRIVGVVHLYPATEDQKRGGADGQFSLCYANRILGRK